jgi:hypothetical protein
MCFFEGILCVGCGLGFEGAFSYLRDKDSNTAQIE